MNLQGLKNQIKNKNVNKRKFFSIYPADRPLFLPQSGNLCKLYVSLHSLLWIHKKYNPSAAAQLLSWVSQYPSAPLSLTLNFAIYFIVTHFPIHPTNLLHVLSSFSFSSLTVEKIFFSQLSPILPHRFSHYLPHYLQNFSPSVLPFLFLHLHYFSRFQRQLN